MTDNVVPIRPKDRSASEVVSSLVKESAENKLRSLLFIGRNEEDGYTLGNSTMSGMELLFLVTYLKERVMVQLRDGGVMPE